MTQWVLLSGWGIDARIWQPLAPHWPAGAATTAPDWPGYGAEAPLDDPLSLETLAERMAPALSPEAIWVGWSLGALLAVRLLDYLPAPRGIVMLGMGARFCMADGVTPAALRAFRRAVKRDPCAAWQRFVGWQLAGEPDPPRCRQRLTSLIGSRPGVDTATLLAGLDWLECLGVSRQLAAPPCPILTLTGENDLLLDATTRRDAAVCLPGAGHCPQLSRPEALAAALMAFDGEDAP
ncbi:alpha/beta fold hydrolase [Halomonas sp. GXIMD04776]|uniref:alpha/beta fold hydrolase n=1 Tax=Halomonas sp. GXIMD04776 TaxID=3415605 RepID=UPI003CBA22AD